MTKAYTVEKKKVTYIARFFGGIERTFKAVNEFQANRIAEGLAKSNKWTLQSLGRE